MPDYTPEWFSGNVDAVRLLDDLGYVAHIWDDLIDKDKPVTDEAINSAFERALIDIPTNPVYLKYQPALSPLIFTGVMGFHTANRMEKSGDAHQLEISHGLRYAVGHVGTFLVTVFNSKARAAEILPDVWKAMMPERISDYLKEHTNA